jgi:hypothetical protein
MSTNYNTPGLQNGGSLGAKTEGVAKQAKEFGRDIKGQASELTQSATEAVKNQAAQLTEQAKEVASDAGEKLRATVMEQKAAGADYVGNVANIIRRTAYEFDNDIPQAGHYIRKAAAQLENVSDAMRNRDMSEIVGNVQDFARKQPTAFFSAAVLLGFAAVRFLKSGSNNGVKPKAQLAAAGAPMTRQSAAAGAPMTGM